MKALSIWPEWAFAITHLGKRVENRGWAPPAKDIGSRIAIHASAQLGGRGGKPQARRSLEALTKMACRNGWTWTGLKTALESASKTPGDGLIRGIKVGAVVATARLADCREPLAGVKTYWELGPLCWVLEDVRRLVDPIPCLGRQGLWRVSPMIDGLLRSAATVDADVRHI